MGDTADRSGAERRPGQRDRNRERLYDAALGLFAEQGFEATTMDDIAARAGLSRRTAFNHFPSKTDFNAEWAARRRAEALAVVPDDVPGGDVADRLRAWFHALGEITEAHPDETEQMTLGWLAAGGPVRHPTGTPAVLRSWLAAGVRDGAIDGGVDPEVGAELLFDAYIGILYRWFGTPAERRDPVVPQVDAVVDLVLRGLVARPTG